MLTQTITPDTANLEARPHKVARLGTLLGALALTAISVNVLVILADGATR
jgi:hypothetical protein